MKKILLNSDDDVKAYLVPDEVADNLVKFCIEFYDDWLVNSKDAINLNKGNYIEYMEDAFICYLNEWMVLEDKSIFVENLGFIEYENDLPEEYKSIPWFSF